MPNLIHLLTDLRDGDKFQSDADPAPNLNDCCIDDYNGDLGEKFNLCPIYAPQCIWITLLMGTLFNSLQKSFIGRIKGPQ